MTWVKWLWGNERWDGCGAPWDHNVVKRQARHPRAQVAGIVPEMGSHLLEGMDTIMGYMGCIHRAMARCRVPGRLPPCRVLESSLVLL